MVRLRKYYQDCTGVAAAEFALILPAFAALTIGAIHLCIMVYMNSLLQFAVDDAARCESVKTTVCGSTTATQSHAATTFGFASLSPNFVASSATCGNQVTGSVTYPMNAIIRTFSVAISAKSCFPIQD
jgi:Flp pilus assembly protein TadG